MDTVITQVYAELVRQHGASVDDILVTPELREEFLSHSRQSLGNNVEEETLLRRLHNMRKQSLLPKSRDLLAA